MLEILAVDCALHVVCMSERDEVDAQYVVRMQTAGFHFAGYGFAAAARALVVQSFDAVFFEFWFSTDRVLRLARQLQPRALIVVDSVDVHYLREREAARLGAIAPEAAERTRLAELEAYRSADVTIVVSAAEGRLLEHEGIGAVVVVPNIVQQTPRSERRRAHSVLFVGGFDHAPNGLAVDWFAREIWPHVRREVGDAEWIIAGSNAPQAVRALNGSDGVTVLGFVASTAGLLDATAVSVAPLTFGGGMKGKVSEALAAGVPVVTTGWGAQGFEDGAEGAYVVADEPQAFASAIVRLFRDEQSREAMGARGRLLAQQVCSAEAAAPALRDLVLRAASTTRREAVLIRCARVASVALQRGIARLHRQVGPRRRTGDPAQ